MSEHDRAEEFADYILEECGDYVDDNQTSYGACHYEVEREKLEVAIREHDAGNYAQVEDQRQRIVTLETENHDIIRRANQHVKAMMDAEAREQRLRAALESVQWLPDPERECYYCPSCAGRGEHAAQCRLKLALHAAESAATPAAAAAKAASDAEQAVIAAATRVIEWWDYAFPTLIEDPVEALRESFAALDAAKAAPGGAE